MHDDLAVGTHIADIGRALTKAALVRSEAYGWGLREVKLFGDLFREFLKIGLRVRPGRGGFWVGVREHEDSILPKGRGENRFVDFECCLDGGIIPRRKERRILSRWNHANSKQQSINLSNSP